MWEWRVFWSLPANCSDLDVWRVMEETRRRRDVYLVSTAEVGVKLRGERELEVKVMIEKDAGSGAEKWTKLDGGKWITSMITDTTTDSFSWISGYVSPANLGSNLQKHVVTVLEKLQSQHGEILK